jgi:RPEL repeat
MCRVDACAAGLERKMSMRANRDDLVQKGILLPDSSLDLIDHPIAEGKTPILTCMTNYDS